VSDTPANSSEQPLQRRVRKAFALLFLSVLAVAGGWEGFQYAKLHLSISYASREFSDKQYMRAEFWAGRAISVDERNVEATRLMAEINEAQDKPAALGWRIKVVQREPQNTEDIMAWAKSALRFGRDEMALEALKSLPREFQDHSADYNELMAGCALAGHQPGVAEACFIKAAELGKDNPVHRMNLLAFRLANSPNPEVRAAAGRDIEGMAADSRVSLFAIRALLYDAVRNRDNARALRYSEKLRSIPEHNFDDDLSCLQAVMSEPAFRPALEEIKHRAGSDVTRVTEAGDWLNSHGLAAETLRWYATLPDTLRSSTRVQMTAAEGYLATKDWKTLETFLSTRGWGDFEYLRRAMLIRCMRELSEPWEKEWKQLAAEVDAKPPQGFLLAQLVIGWKWRNEALALLWGAATKPQTESKALEYLWDLYSQSNDTSQLWRVAREQSSADPSNPAKKNNDAFLSLLLYGASERSERLAREASTSNPKMPEWAATYAYALHLAGKNSEAKKVMGNLPPDALARPGIALYYAIVLEANADNAQARETLAKLNPSGMLPEERKLAAGLAEKLNAAGR